MRFDGAKADRAVEFFNRYLRHTKGRWYGQTFNLRTWQEEHIRQIFGRVDDHGNRTIRQVYWEIPKKNGKSEIAAGIALKLLFADDEPGAEVYSAAADRDQAAIVFDVASAMVRLHPVLLRAAGGPKGIIDSRKRIICPKYQSYYRVLSAEVGGKHGFNSHGVVFDEIHAQRDTRLWEVLTFGAGAARLQPLTFAITTAGIPGESPVAEMLHEEADQILRGVLPCPESFYPVIYSVPEKSDWTDEEVWHACNPALGDFLSIDSVREEYDRARRRPSEQNSFRRLRLNQWVAQETRWIDMADWDACSATPLDIAALKSLPCYVGIDLSAKLDITAVVVVWVDSGTNFHIWPLFFVPRDNLTDRPNIEAHRYREWEKRGLLTITPGNTVDFASVRARVNELSNNAGLNIAQIAADPMFAQQLMQELAGDGFEVIEFRQNFRNFTEPCREFEAAVSDRRIRHGANPIMRWMVDCVTVKQDPSGAIRPVKPDRLKTSKRIDGVVAALMGMSRAMLNQQPYDPYTAGRSIMVLN